jgi:hypothetical protein
MLKRFFLDKGDFKVTGYYVTEVPDYSHFADDCIKPCNCHMMPLSMATGFNQGVRLLNG